MAKRTVEYMERVVADLEHEREYWKDNCKVLREAILQIDAQQKKYNALIEAATSLVESATPDEEESHNSFVYDIDLEKLNVALEALREEDDG